MFRVRLLKVLCTMLCVLLAIGLTGAAATAEMVSSWEELNEAANNGATEVFVISDITFGEGETTVVFNNAVVIQSGGELPYPNGKGYMIDGGGKQILRIENEDEVNPLTELSEVRDLIFKNGSATEDEAGFNKPGCGGAVFVQGDLLAVNCDFVVNQAMCGGAVYTVGNLTLDQCVMVGNLAEENGGAVYADGDFVTITGGLITRNYVSWAGSGGGIYAPNGAVEGDVDTVTGNYPDDIVQGR